MLSAATFSSAQDYSEIYIWPPNVGVFAVNKTQQFAAWGIPSGGGTPVDLTNQVDWYLEENPFPAVGTYPIQDLKPSDIADIAQTGLVTVKSTWGRVNVACCYPKGCQISPETEPSGINPSITTLLTR